MGSQVFCYLFLHSQRQCEASIQNHALQTTTLCRARILKPSLLMHTVETEQSLSKRCKILRSLKRPLLRLSWHEWNVFHFHSPSSVERSAEQWSRRPNTHERVRFEVMARPDSGRKRFELRRFQRPRMSNLRGTRLCPK